jgi:ribose/xylose/arabinose/galactoside ABC-type transport system permease subunit
MRPEGAVTRFGRWWFAGGEPRLGALDLGLILGFVALLLAGAWFAEAFFTERNMSNLMRQVVANGLISLGMLLVILTGGIDLSVGSVVALGGVLFAGIADQLGIGPALVIAIAAGAAAGLVNGFIIARFKLQSFIITLATMGIVRGCVYLYTEVPLSPSHLGFRNLGATLVGTVPLSMIIMLACYALVWCYLNRTPAGRATIAIGGNEETVRLAGVNVQRTVGVAYTLSGALSAFRARSSSRAWALRNQASVSPTSSTPLQLASSEARRWAAVPAASVVRCSACSRSA